MPLAVRRNAMVFGVLCPSVNTLDGQFAYILQRAV